MSEAPRCGAQTEGVLGIVLGCEQVAGHVGPHVEGRTYWDTDDAACRVCGYGRAEHEGDGEMVHDFAGPAPSSNTRRLAWFSTEELQAEIDRRALPPYMLENTQAEFERVRDQASRHLAEQAERLRQRNPFPRY